MYESRILEMAQKAYETYEKNFYAETDVQRYDKVAAFHELSAIDQTLWMITGKDKTIDELFKKVRVIWKKASKLLDDDMIESA